MTPANQEVLDETYQELLKELNEANIRLEKANLECEDLLAEIKRHQESMARND